MLKMRISILILFCCNILSLLSQNVKYDFTIKVNDTLMFQINSNDSLLHFTDRQNFQPSIAVNVGNLNFRENKTFDFYITNHSDSALIIGDNYWMEPLVQPVYNHSIRRILKGETFKFTWILHTLERTGPFSKSGKMNIYPVPINLSFKGSVLPPNLFIFPHTTLKNGFVNEKIVSEFKVFNKPANMHMPLGNNIVEYDDLKIDSVGANHPGVKIEYDHQTNMIAPDTFKIFKVIYTPDKAGKSTVVVSLYINGKKTEHKIYSNVRPRKKKR